MSRTSFRNQIVWLTGASSGIGAALALELAKRGARLALTSRDEEPLQSLAERIRKYGGESRVYSGDIRDLARMKQIASSIECDLGTIDILVANAGSHLFSRPLEFDSAEYLGLMDLNFGGSLRCIEAVLPGMLKRGRGRIAGVASLAGFQALPRAAAYGASKAALIHFLESVRFHFELVGISVSIINPGFVRTPLTDKNDFTMPFLMQADDAARLIAEGLERGQKEINFPLPFVLILRLGRALPYFLYKAIVMKVWARMGFK